LEDLEAEFEDKMVTGEDGEVHDTSK